MNKAVPSASSRSSTLGLCFRLLPRHLRLFARPADTRALLQQFALWLGAFLACSSGGCAEVESACGDLEAAAVGEEGGGEGAHSG